MFVIMGLTWVFEWGAFVFSDKKAPPPESAIIVMNFVNIVQARIHKAISNFWEAFRILKTSPFRFSCVYDMIEMTLFIEYPSAHFN